MDAERSKEREEGASLPPWSHSRESPHLTPRSPLAAARPLARNHRFLPDRPSTRMLAADHESSAVGSPKSGLRNITANFHEVQATAAVRPAERREDQTEPPEDPEMRAEVFEPEGGSEQRAAASQSEAPPFQEIANVLPTERPSGGRPSVRLMRPLDTSKTLEEILATSIKRAKRPRQSQDQRETTDRQSAEKSASPAVSPPALLASAVAALVSPAATPPTLVVQVAEPTAAPEPPPTPQPSDDQPPVLSPALPTAAAADETAEREEEKRELAEEQIEEPTAVAMPSTAVEVEKPTPTKSGRELAQQFKAAVPQAAGFTGVADVVFQLVGTLRAAESALFLARESNRREIRSWAAESFVVM
ncbi:hypothetical protein M3Y99_01743300 [Aphelenchoides fujianensis]|nr:hypothetical protein M3Y99_01743300 [Aphelenchoides fujianensis]